MRRHIKPPQKYANEDFVAYSQSVGDAMRRSI